MRFALLRSLAIPLLAAAIPVGAASTSFGTTNLELRELTLLSRNVYLCDCTVEQFLAVPLRRSSWEKNTNSPLGRIFLSSSRARP